MKRKLATPERYAERTARHYSGSHSDGFWRLLNGIQDEVRRDALYTAGVLLQEMENRVLGWLDDERRHERMEAEWKESQRRRRRTKHTVRVPDE